MIFVVHGMNRICFRSRGSSSLFFCLAAAPLATLFWGGESLEGLDEGFDWIRRESVCARAVVFDEVEQIMLFIAPARCDLCIMEASFVSLNYTSLKPCRVDGVNGEPGR